MGAADVFVRCDELASLPEPARLNYLAELQLLERILPADASVLQVGSMDGQRIVRLLQTRQDLHLTGLEIDSELAALSRRNIAEARLGAEVVLGDITDPPPLPVFDWVLCLNNTLGYIERDDAALRQMQRHGRSVLVSVYGEQFDDVLAAEYFASLGITVQQIQGDRLFIAGLGVVKRYPKRRLDSWGGQVESTPIGYVVTLPPEGTSPLTLNGA